MFHHSMISRLRTCPSRFSRVKLCQAACSWCFASGHPVCYQEDALVVTQGEEQGELRYFVLVLRLRLTAHPPAVLEYRLPKSDTPSLRRTRRPGLFVNLRYGYPFRVVSPPLNQHYVEQAPILQHSEPSWFKADLLLASEPVP